MVESSKVSGSLKRFDLVCYATEAYYPYRERLIASAKRFNIEIAHIWDKERLAQTEFYAANREIFDLPRGGGYWLWKPFIILQALEASEPNALILYADAAIEFEDDLTSLQVLLEEGPGIMLFQDGRYFQNKCWTKRDAFVLMDCDSPVYWFAPQLQAGAMAFRNTPESRAFVREWLEYCQDARILTDSPNEAGKPNWMDFFDHRHDQSILTNLMIKRGILPYRELSAAGRAFTISMEYIDSDGTTSHLEYRMAASPYGILSRPNPTRPAPLPPSFLRRVVRRIKRTFS